MNRSAVCLAVLTLACVSPAAAQIPQTFKNLQVLPKDITRPQLIATMRNIAGSLGVRCTHCHVGPDDLQGMDFATDEKPSKQIARTMLRMTRAINADFVKTLPASDSARQEVTCITCHRRETKPPRPLPELLLMTINSGGVAAAIDQYKKLRAERMEWGLYDFREPTLNIVATSLREQKRIDEALEFARLNAAIFPKSAMVQAALGDMAMQKGDLALAESAFLRAVELDPGNAMALKALEIIKTKRKTP